MASTSYAVEEDEEEIRRAVDEDEEAIYCAKAGVVEYFKNVSMIVILEARSPDDFSVLDMAVMENQLECCKEICKRCPGLVYHINKIDRTTSLMHAAWKGNTEMIELLTSVAYNSTNPNRKYETLLRMTGNNRGNDTRGRSALHLAVDRKHLEAARMLMEKDPKGGLHYGPDVNDETPLLMAMNKLQDDPDYENTWRLILKILPSQCLVKARVREWTPLHLAAFNGNLDAVKDILESCPECAMARDFLGQNFLHIAVMCDYNDVVKYAMNYITISYQYVKLARSVFNGQDCHGNTPLHVAAERKNRVLVSMIASFREVVRNIANESGETASDVMKFDITEYLKDQSQEYGQSSKLNQTINSFEEKFGQVPPLSSEYTIYRVPERLRSVQKEAYTPMLVSVGPFHYGDEKLKSMEETKLRCLYIMLQRRGACPLADIVEMAEKVERETRNCYAEIFPSITKHQFVDMMILDGCFVVDLMMQYKCPELRTELDPIFKNHWIFNVIHRDLLLLENQLPFFLLEKIFSLTTAFTQPFLNFEDVVNHFLGYYEIIFNNLLPVMTDESEHMVGIVLKSITSLWPRLTTVNIPDNDEYKDVFIPSATEPRLTTDESEHIVGIVLKSITSVWSRLTTEHIVGIVLKSITSVWSRLTTVHIVGVVLKSITSVWSRLRTVNMSDNDEYKDLRFIPSATELHQVGIRFANQRRIEFSEGTLTLPSLIVDHRTESLVRNLLAFEQSHCGSIISGRRNQVQGNGESTTILSDYVTLIDCLINTSDDVKFLRDQGIIHNHLGDNEEVAQIFNKLRSGIVTRPNAFHFYDIFQGVNDYYGAKWNRWKATLKRDYFNNPWAKISFGAAVFLISLSLTQTFCSLVQIFAPGGKL